MSLTRAEAAEILSPWSSAVHSPDDDFDARFMAFEALRLIEELYYWALDERSMAIELSKFHDRRDPTGYWSQMEDGKTLVLNGLIKAITHNVVGLAYSHVLYWRHEILFRRFGPIGGE